MSDSDPVFDELRRDSNGTRETLFDELAGLDPVNYDHRRNTVAEELGIRVGTLDSEVARRRRASREPATVTAQGLVESWPVDPWPYPVDGADLLDELEHTIRRYLAAPPQTARTIALWILHAWAHDAAGVSPLLTFTSPEKRCGKTTALLLLRYLAPRPLPAANATPAVLFRAVELWCPTILIDEGDTFLGEADELRGIINSGHVRAMAQTVRCVGDEHEPRAFSTWSPKAIALIGRMHDTLRDRSIVIEMRRRLPSEYVERLRADQADAFLDLRRKAARWAEDSIPELRCMDPEMPEGLNDRAADNWRVLVAIANLAGGEWPLRAHEAALALSGDSTTEADSARTMLLGDAADLIEAAHGRLASTTLAEQLGSMEERPWPEWSRGRPITTRQVASLLRPFEIVPRSIRTQGKVVKGYLIDDFREALARYTPSRSVTGLQVASEATHSDSRNGYTTEAVTDPHPRKTAPEASCNRVTDEEEGAAEGLFV